MSSNGFRLLLSNPGWIEIEPNSTGAPPVGALAGEIMAAFSANGPYAIAFLYSPETKFQLMIFIQAAM